MEVVDSISSRVSFHLGFDILSGTVLLFPFGNFKNILFSQCQDFLNTFVPGR